MSSTDAHFELELDKLREQFEEDYRAKLEFEIENIKKQQIGGSLRSSGRFEEDFDHAHDMQSHQLSLSAAASSNSSSTTTTLLTNFMKLKEELRQREGQVEEYRMRIENMECTFRENLRKCEGKLEVECKKVEAEIKEHYRQLLAKSSGEIDQMQLLVKKLKKANVDSNKVIDTLKAEMVNANEKHLSELASLKLGAEREKQGLREDCERWEKRVGSLQTELAESEESASKQCDLLRAELKLEYGAELSKMNGTLRIIEDRRKFNCFNIF